MNPELYKILPLLLLTLLSCGCETYRFQDRIVEQPWVGLNQRARSEILFQPGIVPMSGIMGKMTWHDDSLVFGKYPAGKTVAKSLNYLEKCGYTIPVPEGYPIEFNNLTDPQVHRPDLAEISKSYLGEIYPVTYQIVCLRPLIVLVSKQRVFSGNMSDSWRRYPEFLTHVCGTAHNPPEIPLDVLLSGGFQYGTKFVLDGDIQWFSPDLKQCAVPLELDDDKRAVIEVSWGNLIITRIGEQVVVTTK